MISIHAPHAGRDVSTTVINAPAISRFQSTRPMRGATNFCQDDFTSWDISIHAPHAGRDLCITYYC